MAPDRLRTLALSVALGLPCVFGAIGAIWLGTRELAATTIVRRAADDLARAVVDNDLSLAHAAIRNGANPNAEIAFSHPDLTGGDTINATPLAISAARGADNMVRMLLAHGADMSLDGNAAARCVAIAFDRPAVRWILEEWAAGLPAPDCARLHAITPAYAAPVR